MKRNAWRFDVAVVMLGHGPIWHAGVSLHTSAPMSPQALVTAASRSALVSTGQWHALDQWHFEWHLECTQASTSTCAVLEQLLQMAASLIGE